MNSREQYVENCKQEAEKYLTQNCILQYVRNKKGQPRGVVIAFRDPNSKMVRVGWSLCNIKADKFDKYIGVAKAVERAVPPISSLLRSETPKVVDAVVQQVLERTSKYFK